MALISLSLLILVFLTVVGRAMFSLVGYDRHVLRAWLLAPAMGLAILLLPLMVLNQAGLPIRSFAWPVTGTLAVAASILLWRKRPVFPFARLAPFWAIVLVNMLWVSWPALRFGLNWVSFSNDDMANYCLAAERFASHGFFDVPSGIDLNRRDYAQTYWYMHVSDLMRFGSEHLLAWMRSITGEPATRLFMTVIVSLAGIQIMALAGLVLHFGRFRRWALLSAALLAISPLFLLGSLYQLIAQVGGMALLLLMIALITENRPAPDLKGRFRQSIAPAIVGAMLSITYPEVTPFAVLVFVPYAGLLAFKNPTSARRLLAFASLTLAGIIVFLHHNLFSYIYTFSKQFESATRATDLTLSLFPFFMIPTGFSNLFGWMPIGADFAEPFLSASVLGGMALTIVILFIGIRSAIKGTPISILVVVQLALAINLFMSGNDFGLYKLAMFLQPALFAALASLLFRLRPQTPLPWIIILGYFCTTIPTALHYTINSCGLSAGGLTELRWASKLGLAIRDPAKTHSQIISSVDNVVAAKFAASELRGHDVIFASRDFFQPIIHLNYRHYQPLLRHHPFFETLKKTPALEELHSQRYVRTNMLWNTEFTVHHQLEPAELFLSVAPELSLFNKFSTPESTRPDAIFKLEPIDKIKNYLVFVHSGRGNHYYLGDRRRIALFQQESDPYHPTSTFTALGRFILMRVENPDPEFFLRIAGTRSALKPRIPWNPRARILGEQEYPLEVHGDGAFHRYIGPIRPLWHEGAAYIAIDFSEIPRPVADSRPGLKALYHTNIPLDFRRIVGWGRDISVISKEQYARLKRPSLIERFPEDITTAHGLEFSGAYEDAWISPKSEWRLDGASEGDFVRVRINTPEIEGTPLGTGELLVSLNRGSPIRLKVTNGVADWLFPVGKAQSVSRIEMNFSQAAPLPNHDGRMISTRLERIEILRDSPPKWDYSNAQSPRLAAPGLDADGWMEKSAAIFIPSLNRQSTVVLKIEIPSWAKIDDTSLRTQLGASKPTETGLKPGFHEIEIAANPCAEPQILDLKFSNAFKLIAPDGRIRAGRLLQVEIVPAKGAQPPATDAQGGSSLSWNFEGAPLAKAPAQGIDPDGWTAAKAKITAPPCASERRLRARLEIPGWADLKENSVEILLGENLLLSKKLPFGFHDLNLPIPPVSTDTDISIRFSDTLTLPAPDGRKRSARLLTLELSTTPAP